MSRLTWDVSWLFHETTGDKHQLHVFYVIVLSWKLKESTHHDLRPAGVPFEAECHHVGLVVHVTCAGRVDEV